MITFFLAGTIGLVASSRWTSGAWFLFACPVAALSLLGDGSLEAKVLSLLGMTASYNAGLLIGLLASHLENHLGRVETGGGQGAVTRNR